MLGMLSTTPYSMLRADNFVDDHEQGVRTRRTAPRSASETLVCAPPDRPEFNQGGQKFAAALDE